MTKRHQLIFVDSKAPVAFHTCHGDKKDIKQRVMDWLQAGLPCIYTRQTSENNTINLGLTLLVEGHKQRIALAVNKSDILKEKALPHLMDMRYFFQEVYNIHGLSELFSSLGFEQANFISVYGSFLFHYLSGQSFVNSTSDLDVLITYQGCTEQQLKSLAANLATKFNRLIDGEVRFDALGDIAIKELLSSSPTVLCKKKERVILLPRAMLYEYYPTLSHA